MRPFSSPAWLSAASLLMVGRSGSAAAAGLDGPLVDLGYSHYRGAYNVQHDLNTWRGIRYAAPPIGPLRWQMPQPPLDQRALGVIDATELPPLCPQAGAYGTPVEYGFNGGLGDEDCLYLNVYAPAGATDLPVLVWIHGGGYSLFGARYDPSAWIDAGGHGFVAVEIQYRLGAFGFLASPEVQAKGQLNAGLLDQRQALSWVQKHIAQFGGDPARVTIAGESSGAGSTLHHALAYDGRDDGLFSSVFVSSPYLPLVHAPDDPLPRHYYQKFVEFAGCGGNTTAHHCGQRTFECLVAADTRALQEANEAVSATQGYFGTFAWLPVVDGHIIQGSPADQLSRGRVAGERVLVGTNANEGVPLTNPRVSDRHEYEAFIHSQFSSLNAVDRTRIDTLYRIDEALEYGSRAVFDTLGSSGPSALLQSGIATGIQQAVFNIAAESTFACPAQWLTEAFSDLGRPTWRYQYSLTPSYHGADLSAMFDLGSGSAGISADFRTAFQSMLSAFISSGSPVISAKVATGGKDNSSVPLLGDQLFWPEYTRDEPLQLNMNTTGGIETTTVVTNTLSFIVRSGSGVVNAFNVADVRSWEAGRAERCRFWKAAARRIPY